jgi:PAS domain S-box-containing protein
VIEDVQAIVHATLLGDGWAATGVSSGIISEEGQYVACNDAMCKLTGYSRDELLEMNAGDRLSADEDARRNVADARSGERPWGFGHLRRKDGTVVGVHYWLIHTVVAQVPYLVALMWPTGSGPDLRSVGEVVRAESEKLHEEARAVRAQAEHEQKRAKKNLGEA